MKTSTIKEIGETNAWDNPHGGKVFYTWLTLENGDKIKLGKQKENAFKVGDTINYEVVEEGKKWKEVKENPFRPNGFMAQANNQCSKSAQVGMAIKVAFDLVYKEKGLDEAKKLTKEILLFAQELVGEDSPSC